MSDYTTQREVERRHRAAVQRKYEKIAMYRAIIEAWEAKPDQMDDEYLKEVRRKLNMTENQVKAMKDW